MKKQLVFKKLQPDATRIMQLNRITLAFPDQNEEIFRLKYFHNSIRQFRFSFILVTFLYGIFGYLDLLVAKEFISLFHFIRFGVVIPLFVFTFLLSFTRYFVKVWQPLLFICFVAGGIGITIMTVNSPENFTYFGGMMLIFSAGYFFITLRFFLATIAGWITLILFNIGSVFFSSIGIEMIVSNNFFFISANIIGMFAAYNIEFYKRRDFFLNQQLDYQNTEITETNNYLESKVEERTKELLLSKERAEESDKLKTAFLNNISHEIRTPFNGILGFLQLIQDEDLSETERKAYYNIINKSSDRLIKTINDIVEIAQIQAGQTKLSISKTNVGTLTNTLYNRFKPYADSKGIAFVLRQGITADNAVFATDEEKLNSILSNLIDNAIKFTKTGLILLHAVNDANTLKFSVQDTGIGIAPARQDAIFERFVQADITDKQAFQGAGLGLAISKAYVEMLGGRIWVESNEGKGSVFCFTLPNGSESLSASAVKPSYNVDNTNGNTAGLKILIAEDEAVSDLLLGLIFKKFSFETLHAKTGAEAVEICRNHPDINLILMDMKMPEMNGLDAVQKIRGFNTSVVIIAQTAYALAGDKDSAIRAGCNDYITKPLVISELLAKIEKHMNLNV
jgi:signal transduction histidine kinase/ActR/RegA family two-component response regulator